MLQILAVAAYTVAAAIILSLSLKQSVTQAARWSIIIAVGGLFSLITLMTVMHEGLMQFWINHTTSLAGVQVWFDLLIAVTICFVLIAPRARSVGMPLLPWGIAVIATACIALLPMLSRLLWLEAQTKR